MKFFLFADFHYAPGIFMGGTPEALRAFQKRAEDEGCEFMIHAGDFTNCRDIHKPLIDEYNGFHIPSYHVLGNHDADNAPYERVLEYYRMPNGYYYFDHGGYRIIAANTNYYYDNGEYVAYSMGNYIKHPETRECMSPAQLAWLRETIEAAPGPCIILSHASFERPDGVKERDEVRAIINEANARRPHSVLACINGHHHRDHHTVIDGVLYLEVNATRFDWLEKRHDCYPPDLCEQITSLSHTVVYEDPLGCVVTVEGTTFRVEGSESRMFMGVGRAEAGCKILDVAGRPVVPRISSFEITL
jgi:3',5'-cyclic AMP phosphodiesterase CpdA